MAPTRRADRARRAASQRRQAIPTLLEMPNLASADAFAASDGAAEHAESVIGDYIADLAPADAEVVMRGLARFVDRWFVDRPSARRYDERFAYVMSVVTRLIENGCSEFLDTLVEDIASTFSDGDGNGGALWKDVDLELVLRTFVDRIPDSRLDLIVASAAQRAISMAECLRDRARQDADETREAG